MPTVTGIARPAWSCDPVYGRPMVYRRSRALRGQHLRHGVVLPQASCGGAREMYSVERGDEVVTFALDLSGPWTRRASLDPFWRGNPAPRLSLSPLLLSPLMDQSLHVDLLTIL